MLNYIQHIHSNYLVKQNFNKHHNLLHMLMCLILYKMYLMFHMLIFNFYLLKELMIQKQQLNCHLFMCMINMKIN